MSKTKPRVTTHSSNMAVLVGNGVNINFGGNAYSNSYIHVDAPEEYFLDEDE